MENIIGLPNTPYFLSFDGKNLDVVSSERKPLISYSMGLQPGGGSHGIVLFLKDIILVNKGVASYVRSCKPEPCAWAQNITISQMLQIENQLFVISSEMLFRVNGTSLEILRQIEEKERVFAWLGSAIIVKLGKTISKLSANGEVTLIAKCIHDTVLLNAGGILCLGVSPQQVDHLMQKDKEAEDLLYEAGLAQGIQYNRTVQDQARIAAKRQKYESLLFICIPSGMISYVTDPKVSTCFSPSVKPAALCLSGSGVSLTAELMDSVFQGFSVKQQSLYGQYVGRLREEQSELFHLIAQAENDLKVKAQQPVGIQLPPQRIKSAQTKELVMDKAQLSEAEARLMQSLSKNKAVRYEPAKQGEHSLTQQTETSQTQSNVSSGSTQQKSDPHAERVVSTDLDPLSQGLADLQTLQDTLRDLEDGEKRCREELRSLAEKKARVHTELNRVVSYIYAASAAVKGKIDKM